MSTFSDHFSGSAAGYASFRPTYPPSLFRWLATESRECRRAWDCGTGNGQAAASLAEHFRAVIATDASEAQVAKRTPAHGVHYAVTDAESCALAPMSVDLVTVAQALHWFDLNRFYAEVRRVLVPGGLLAVWMYGLPRVDDAINAQIDRFYKEEVGAFWPPERALVDAGYAGISFPFKEIRAPSFRMEAQWTLYQLAGYLETWSAVSRYRRDLGHSPVARFIVSLAPLWGESGVRRSIQWPMELRVGRMSP